MQKPSREAQKSFTWDASVGSGTSVDANAVQQRKYSGKNIIITFQNQNRSAMSHDMALKLLGLSGGENKTRAGVSVVRFPNWVGEPGFNDQSRCRGLWRISQSRK